MQHANRHYDLLTELRERLWKVPASLVVGGHYCCNIHPNLIYNDAKTVLDQDRRSWSVDARLGLFDVLRVTGMYREGVVKDVLEAGARFDCYSWNRAVTSGWAIAMALTAGINISWASHLRLQLNYKWKFQTGDLSQDTGSNVMLLSTQVKIEARRSEPARQH